MLSEEARDTLMELFPPILSVKDVARELKVSETTVRRMIWDGELDVYMVGVEWEINRETLINYLSRTSNI